MREKRKFKDVFNEDGENLVLLIDANVKGEDFNKDYKFTEEQKLNSVNFHKYRYLDLAVEIEEGVLPKIMGFYPAE